MYRVHDTETGPRIAQETRAARETEEFGSAQFDVRVTVIKPLEEYLKSVFHLSKI